MFTLVFCIICLTISGIGVAWWYIETRPAKRIVSHVSTAIIQEINRSPEWWEREYRALTRKAFPPKPFDPAEHEGHDIITEQTYANRTVRQYCVECPTDV